MNKKDLYNNSNKIDDALPERPETTKKKRINIWIKCMAAVVGFYIVMLGTMVWYEFYKEQHPMTGDEHSYFYEIYPTVMVDGEFYEWDSICRKLPEDCVFYGEINHTTKNVPLNNCEFVSVFSAEGEIYTTPDEACVYLKLTTYWLNDTVVKFIPN